MALTITRDEHYWPEKYVGMEYTELHDCAWFVRHVLQRETGLDIRLPEGINWRRTNVGRMTEIAQEFAYPVDKPEPMDAVIMRVQGNKYSLGSHVGVYAPFREQEWYLHSVKGIGSVWTPKPNLAALQLEVVSYHRWIT